MGTAWGVQNRFAAGVMILSVFEGAYIAEIIRGSLLSIEGTQIEAARAVGFTRKQTLRYDRTASDGGPDTSGAYRAVCFHY